VERTEEVCGIIEWKSANYHAAYSSLASIWGTNIIRFRWILNIIHDCINWCIINIVDHIPTILMINFYCIDRGVRSPYIIICGSNRISDAQLIIVLNVTFLN
jgi:hypothetical protein